MKKISYAKLALSLLLVSTVLVGCGKGTNSVSTQTSQPSSATVEKSPQLQSDIDKAFDELKKEQQKFLDALKGAITITDKKKLEIIKSDAVSTKIENLQTKIKEYRKNQLPKLKEEERASIEKILGDIDSSLEEISQKVINPFKTGLTRDAIENVQKQLDFFTRRDISQDNYGNFGDTTVGEITTFLQDKQKSLEDNIKNLKSPDQASPKSTIDPEIQKLSNRIAQLEKEKTSSNTTFLVAILALLASVISLLRSRKRSSRSSSIGQPSPNRHEPTNKRFSRFNFWSKETNPKGDGDGESPENSSASVASQNLSTNETQFIRGYEAYQEIDEKFSTKFKDIERKITEGNRKIEEIEKISNRVGDLENNIRANERANRKMVSNQSSYPSETSVSYPELSPQTQNPISLEESNLAKIYNRDRESFSQQAINVTATEESLTKLIIGSSSRVIFEKNRRGNYSIIKENGTEYLVPSNNLRLNQHNYKAIEDFFDCKNLQLEGNFELLKPARVSALPGGETWQLEERGILQF
jgi:hypothetical protein